MKESKSVSEKIITFEEFAEKVIKPIVKNYKPMNNREEWYHRWDLIPYGNIDPNAYTKRLMQIREDPKVTWQFKTFLLQLVSIVHHHYLKPQEEGKE